MTTHYIDLTVVPDPETNAPQLLGLLYDRLHMALVEQQYSDIGVSFPRYSRKPRGLGHVLRLHGTRDGLASLMNMSWLKGVRDHVRTSEVAAVPDGIPHRTIKRKQFKTNANRLRRRRMKRKGETWEQAKAAIPDTVERRTDLPYIHLRSKSTRQQFCLFIELGHERADPVEGSFNSYGLSATTTVPWF